MIAGDVKLINRNHIKSLLFRSNEKIFHNLRFYTKSAKNFNSMMGIKKSPYKGNLKNNDSWKVLIQICYNCKQNQLQKDIATKL